jgi:hypothetical protein
MGEVRTRYGQPISVEEEENRPKWGVGETLLDEYNR